MDWLYFFVGSFCCFILLQLLRLLRSDCDLSLKWAELFGCSTDCLKGKVVWVTGASSGIGEALALDLASSGCRLILSARREDRLKNLKQQCIENGYAKQEDILVLKLDLLAFDTHAEAVQNVLKYFKKIDVLVNNAGRSQRALWEKTDFEVDKHVLDINVLGPLSLSKAVLPYFIQQKSGHIVVTSSLSGKIGIPGLGSYSGSKHALHGWFDSLRIEVLEYNIDVTMVCPGPVFSEALVHAFTAKTNEELGVVSRPDEKRMSTARCARLMAIAMANKLDEVWISMNPELLYVYLFQYCPSLALRLGKLIGKKRLKFIKDGKTNLH